MINYVKICKELNKRCRNRGALFLLIELDRLTKEAEKAAEEKRLAKERPDRLQGKKR